MMTGFAHPNNYTFGDSLILVSIILLGGIGNPYGAMAGALVIGVGQEWSTLIIPSMYKEAIAFSAMALCLMFRPRGLWG